MGRRIYEARLAEEFCQRPIRIECLMTARKQLLHAFRVPDNERTHGLMEAVVGIEDFVPLFARLWSLSGGQTTPLNCYLRACGQCCVAASFTYFPQAVNPLDQLDTVVIHLVAS